jgi:hypothetical protein
VDDTAEVTICVEKEKFVYLDFSELHLFGIWNNIEIINQIIAWP